jgi:hypothetical protein
MKKQKKVSTDSEEEYVTDPEEGSLRKNDMDVDSRDDMPNPNGLSQNSGSQEWDIFHVPPGQVIPINQDLEMRDDTNRGEPGDGLGQDASKPGGVSIGVPDAVHGGLRKSDRESKEPTRFDPNNHKTY